MKRIVVIGGGAAGLGAAYTLQEKIAGKQDIDFLLLEKENRFGGQILTEKRDGFVFEKGPDCFVSEKPWVFELADKVGIRDRATTTRDENKGTFIFSRGRLHPLPEGVMSLVPTSFWPFVTSSLFSWPGKIRMGMDFFVPKRTSTEEESLAQFVRRRLGKDALEKLADPLIAGIHASDPEKMSIKATFPRFLEMEQNHRSLIKASLAARKKIAALMKAAKAKSPGMKKTFFMSFTDGMQEFTDAVIAKINQENLRPGKKAEKIERPEGTGAYVIRLADGESIEADAIVFTGLCGPTADLVEGLDKELASTLRTIPLVTSATVSLAFKSSDLTESLKGFGLIIPSSEKRKIMAATFSSNKWRNRAPEGYSLIRCFVGGATNQELVELDDKEMIEMVRDEIRDIIGITATPQLTAICRWIKAMPQYTIGHLDRLAKIDERLADYPGLFLAGASYRGVGVPDCINSGNIAAANALNYLEGK